MNTPLTQREQLRAKISEIIQEMQHAGFWQSEPPPPEAFEFTRAFAGDTMAYSQWLQFIFIPRVTELLDTDGELPATSSVGAQGVREFDGQHEAADLVRLLAEFDCIIERDAEK